MTNETNWVGSSRAGEHGRSVVLSLAVAIMALLLGCGSNTGTDAGADDGATEPNALATPINELQYIGSHNSYRVQPSDELFEAEKAVVGTLGDGAGEFGSIDSWLYTHAPLPEQLDAGIRSFELDVWADPEGGRFASPIAAPLLGVDPAPVDDAMDDPGFKVFHIVDVDTNSTCPTLIRCLTDIREFIEAEPDGAPIVILMELKDDPLPEPIDVTEIVPIEGELLDDLDSEIRSVFSEEQILSPDDVRGDAPSLREAVETDGWPTVEEAGGTVMFLMDNAGDKRLDYLEGHPNLKDRVLFTTSGEGEDDGAVLKVNTPEDGARITELVETGYFVRTRADADLEYSEERREIALNSGAQIVSTDYPIDTVNEADGYGVEFDGEIQIRCNPVTATEVCEV